MKLTPFIISSILCGTALAAQADRLVLLHTNDTHSQIEPNDDNLGGILRRKVVIDSVRDAEPNVLLVDCGDMVQGSLYFTLYGGQAERDMMNALGYEIQILGNHEFDNGVDSLAAIWSGLNAEKLATNYDMRGTKLENLFKPYTIRQYGDRKIGLMAINLDPKGMIADDKSIGVKYLDAIEAANSMAWYLRNIEHADAVIALTHVGYDTANPPTPSDIDIAAASRGIDIIVGGHSHTTVSPDDRDAIYKLNADGDTVLVVQTGSRGVAVGEIDIDLATMRPQYRLISIDSRLDDRIDNDVAALLAPYTAGIEQLRTAKIGTMAQEMPSGSNLLTNWIADVMMEMGSGLTDRPIDVTLINRGGIRRGLPKGKLTKELIMTMLPFDNKLVVMEISGSDLKEALDYMAKKGNGGISKGFDRHDIDTSKTYTLLTIDYLANGGDYLHTLPNGTVITRSPDRLDTTLINYLNRKRGKTIRYNDSSTRL